MKRIAIILLGAIIAISASAQIYHTTSSFQTIETAPKIHPKLEFYVKVGANIMNADWDEMYWPYGYDRPNINGKSKLGLDVNFGFMSHFRPSRPSDFYWGAELSFTQVGGGFNELSYMHEYGSYESYSFYFPSTSVALWSVSLSPTIGWKKEIFDNIWLDLHFNPGILGHLGKDINYNETHYYRGDYQYHNRNTTIQNGLNVPLKGGIGLWFNKFNIDFSYRGLIKCSGGASPNYSNVIISLGYKF